jgi:dsDNA-specific endonuclease/ATPase MutS2
MKIFIEIECESISEFYSHLTKIQRDINRKARKEKLNPLFDEFNDGEGLDDNNCYGTHVVNIKQD